MISTLQNYVPRLFFIKRLPSFWTTSEWAEPKSKDEMARLIENEGFLSSQVWTELDKHPTLKQDIADLEEHLLPAFFEFNQKAMYYQNAFYLYQWIFMLGAFFTTVLGTATTYSYSVQSDGGSASTVFGVLTATLSGILLFFSVISEQSKPQARWANYRRMTEELRTNYYCYIAHLDPYAKPDRNQQMRQMVIAVRRKASERS